MMCCECEDDIEQWTGDGSWCPHYPYAIDLGDGRYGCSRCGFPLSAVNVTLDRVVKAYYEPPKFVYDKLFGNPVKFEPRSFTVEERKR